MYQPEWVESLALRQIGEPAKSGAPGKLLRLPGSVANREVQAEGILPTENGFRGTNQISPINAKHGCSARYCTRPPYPHTNLACQKLFSRYDVKLCLREHGIPRLTTRVLLRKKGQGFASTNTEFPTKLRSRTKLSTVAQKYTVSFSKASLWIYTMPGH